MAQVVLSDKTGFARTSEMYIAVNYFHHKFIIFTMSTQNYLKQETRHTRLHLPPTRVKTCQMKACVWSRRPQRAEPIRLSSASKSYRAAATQGPWSNVQVSCSPVLFINRLQEFARLIFSVRVDRAMFMWRLYEYNCTKSFKQLCACLPRRKTFFHKL